MARHEMELNGGTAPPEVRLGTYRSPGSVGRGLPPPPPDTDPGEEPPHHLREYLLVLRNHRRLVIGSFTSVLGLTILVTLLVPRLYTATTRLQVARQSPIQLRLADSVRRADENEDRGADPTTFLATQVAALTSRDLAERVIGGRWLAQNEAFLHPSPERGGLLALAGSVLGVLRPRGWEVEPPATAEVPDGAGPVDPKLLDRYAKYLSVREVRGTDLIDVGFTTPSPSLSAFLAAAHAQAFIEANDDARRATDAVAETFLDQQLADARRQVEKTETALASFAAEYPNVAVNQEQKISGSRIAELSTLLTKAEAERASLESRYEFLSSSDSAPLAYLMDRPGVQKLRLALLDIRAQRAAFRQRLGPNHPQMLELAEVESELSQQLQGEVAQGVAAVRNHYDAARLREEKLERKLTRQEEAGVELQTLGARYDMLKRDMETARKLHGSLQKQRMETGVSAALAAPIIRVIERAEIPQRPSRPKIPVNLALGVFSGLVIAVGAAFARDYFDSSVKSSEEIEGWLHLPTLAAIPNFAVARKVAGYASGAHRAATAGNGGDDLPVLHEPWSRVAEAFRSMRTALLFSASGTPPKVIVVTSARTGEGKTIASLNLASTLAELGARTLLVDADLRHPRCHTAFGVANDRGLSTCLAGRPEVEDLIRPLEVPGLFFLPAGPPPRNPAEVVGSFRMRMMLEALKKRFDFVIIDTPPVLPVTDAAILAREADGVVLVVKGNDTPREVVRRARDRLVQAGASFLGVMMNNVGTGWGDPYFYDSYGGYSRPGDGEERG
jgi:succinoglycan biosynthesis transport protein ExoP